MTASGAKPGFPPVLNVYLGTRAVGQITGLPGDGNIFTFTADYLDDPDRPMPGPSFGGRRLYR